jgi:hypothetical protein
VDENRPICLGIGCVCAKINPHHARGTQMPAAFLIPRSSAHLQHEKASSSGPTILFALCLF